MGQIITIRGLEVSKVDEAVHYVDWLTLNVMVGARRCQLRYCSLVFGHETRRPSVEGCTYLDEIWQTDAKSHAAEEVLEVLITGSAVALLL